jgi:DNA-binding CsgD family transcriptional regulator
MQGFSAADPADGVRSGRVTKAAAIAFGLTLVLATLDLISDLRQGMTLAHGLLEATIAAVGLAGLIWATLQIRGLSAETARLRAEAAGLGRRLSESDAEAERWRLQAADLISGLAAAIDQQLRRWNLSAAESEVALLLLKGFSHKEIARLRNVSEATVRQQATAIYRKAGLSGRHDLAAFFLEDLLTPQGSRRSRDAIEARAE